MLNMFHENVRALSVLKMGQRVWKCKSQIIEAMCKDQGGRGGAIWRDGVEYRLCSENVFGYIFRGR